MKSLIAWNNYSTTNQLNTFPSNKLLCFQRNSKCFKSSFKRRKNVFTLAETLFQLKPFFTRSFNSAAETLRVLWFLFLFFFLPLSIASSLEQGCFRFLLPPKPFSFGWSVKDSDEQRGEARRPAGEGVQEAGQIYWAASGRCTIRHGESHASQRCSTR